jgi:hypothetical protein
MTPIPSRSANGRISQLADVEIGHADVPDEPLLLQLGQGRPALFDVLLGVRPVNLVQVDRVDTQPPQARLGLAQDGVPLQAVPHMAGAVVQQRGLREHLRALGQALERPADHAL